jgi:hypothetical protein
MRLSLLPKALFAFAFSAVLAPAGAADMAFSTVPYSSSRDCGAECPRLMQASGQITKDTPQQFLEFARREIARPGLINVLLVHSPGGSVNASITLGKVLRKLGTVVVVARAMDMQSLPPRAAGRRQAGLQANMRFVSGTCASACVYALAGGARRIVPPESKIAVHRMAGNVGQIDPATREYQSLQIYAGESELNLLNEYIAAMGVSTDLVTLAESVPHEEARILTLREIRAFNLGKPKL